MGTTALAWKLLVVNTCVTLPFAALTLYLGARVNPFFLWSLWAFSIACYTVATMWVHSTRVVLSKRAIRSKRHRVLDAYRTCIDEDENPMRKESLWHLLQQARTEHGRDQSCAD